MNDKAPEHMQIYLAKLHKAFCTQLRLHRDYSKASFIGEKFILEYNKKYDTQITDTMLMNIDLVTLYCRLVLKDLVESNYQSEWLDGTGQLIDHYLLVSADMLSDFEFVKYPPFTRKTEEQVMLSFKDYFKNREGWWEDRPEGVSGCFIEVITAHYFPKALMYEMEFEKTSLEDFEGLLTDVTFLVNSLEHELHALVVSRAKENAIQSVKEFMSHVMGPGDFPPGFIIPED